MRNPKWIYQQFVTFEEQAAAVYVLMASRFSPENPELSSFWLDMGMQEKQHAGLLQFCLAEELFAPNLPTNKEIQETAALFDKLVKKASEPDLSVADAFKIAAQMETSEVNAIYDRLTTPVHASMYLLRRKVATTLPDHIGYLYRQACKCNVPEETLKQLERAAAKHSPSS
jgi:rubrerythrin